MDLGILLSLIIVGVVLILVAIIHRSDDRSYYDAEIAKNCMEKGEMKLANQILEILLEEGYRPIFETEDFDSEIETIIVKKESKSISLLFNKNERQYYQIMCNTYTFQETERCEITKRICKINSQKELAYLAIYGNDVYSMIDVPIYKGIDVKHLLEQSLNAVMSINNEYWESQYQKYSMN